MLMKSLRLKGRNEMIIKHWTLLIIGVFILLLSACGQGTAVSDEQHGHPAATEEPSVVEEDTVDTE